MKKKLFLLGGMILICSSLFSFFTLAFGIEDHIVKTQGRIMTLDIKKNTMIVNEKTFVWNQKSAIYNDKGSPITIDKFRPKARVYIEGERGNGEGIMINKIYLLPKYVNPKEKHLYPFME